MDASANLDSRDICVMSLCVTHHALRDMASASLETQVTRWLAILLAGRCIKIPWEGSICNWCIFQSNPICKCELGWKGDNCGMCTPYPGCPTGPPANGTCKLPNQCICSPGSTNILCNIHPDHVFPKFLDGLKAKFELKCKQIRKLKKLDCQVRYIDGQLTILVKAIYKNAPHYATIWQPMDDMIKKHGQSGFPPEVLDGNGER